MAQVFIVDGHSLKLNGQTIVESGFINSITVSPDLQTLYLASSLPYVRKYIKDFDNNGNLTWILDDKTFNNPIKDALQYPTGLLLNGEDLFISLADSNNNSKILRVNAASGSHYYSATTGENISTIYSTSNKGLSAMVLNDKYLYVANTGEMNNGRTIVRLALSEGEKNTSDWVNNLSLSPIQMGISGRYMYVLTADFLSQLNKQIVLINLADGSIFHTFELYNSNELKLGLSKVGALLNIIDKNGVKHFHVDLSAENPVVTPV